LKSKISIALVLVLCVFNLQAQIDSAFSKRDTAKMNYLKEHTVTQTKEETSGIKRLGSIYGFGIYEAKKNEMIVIKDLQANLATNNARQVFAKVPGINIWESDQAGLQLGVGGRGLSPNRTSNFNTRQNGYDISADALGYPESYYTPPIEALEQIEVVRGASALQYGTQFGGMLNFVMKKGNADKPIEVLTRQTLGSFGFFGSFNSIGGTIAKGKLNYYAFFNHKQSNGWRPNSGFTVNTYYAYLSYKASAKLTLTTDYTHMLYLAQQAGGLTDAQFESDAQQSVRSRNWFQVNWNLLSVSLDYKFSDACKINSRTFGLLSQRQSLGNLSPPNVADLGFNRTLIEGKFANLGNETRLLFHYKLFGKDQSLLTGSRFYYGTTRSIQGDGSNGSDADFEFLNPSHPENSDYLFTNINASWFAENIFRINARWSVTPGLRAEYINTASTGYYRIISKDFAGNIIADTSIYNQQNNIRSFIFGGIGLSYKANLWLEVYANITQNYRAVNFNDLRIANPNIKVDPNMKDEHGFSGDAGVRGVYKDIINYDVSVFLLSYEDRIGQILKADQPPLFQDYRYRTNVADSRNSGIECFAELDAWRLYKGKATKNKLLFFTNLAWVRAIYINSQDKSIEGNQVEMAAPFMGRAGLTYKFLGFAATLQGNYVAQHFTDATNAIKVSGGVNGVIPAYSVVDISIKYQIKWFSLEASCNNLSKQLYFTRRADAYPGPGIISSDARSFYITLGFKI
jgi:Fe(3+) dicitrate transport protein